MEYIKQPSAKQSLDQVKRLKNNRQVLGSKSSSQSMLEILAIRENFESSRDDGGINHRVDQSAQPWT